MITSRSTANMPSSGSRRSKSERSTVDVSLELAAVVVAVDGDVCMGSSLRFASNRNALAACIDFVGAPGGFHLKRCRMGVSAALVQGHAPVDRHAAPGSREFQQR